MIDRPQVCRRCNFRRLCFPRAGEAPAAGAAPREAQAALPAGGGSMKRTGSRRARWRSCVALAALAAFGWPGPARPRRRAKAAAPRLVLVRAAPDAGDHDAHARGPRASATASRAGGW